MKTFRGTTLKFNKVSFDIVMNLKNTMTKKIKYYKFITQLYLKLHKLLNVYQVAYFGLLINSCWYIQKNCPNKYGHVWTLYFLP